MPEPSHRTNAATSGHGGHSGPPGGAARQPVLTRDQVRLLIRAALHQSRRTRMRDAAMIAFAYSTACRVSELVAMQTAWIRFAEPVVTDGETVGLGVCDIWRPKVRNWLQGQALGTSTPYLRGYLATRGLAMRPGEPLFMPEGRAAMMTSRAVQHVFRSLNDACGFGEVTPGGRALALATPHALRRSRATHMRQAGIALEVIQAMLGHASITSTMHYLIHERGVVAAAAVKTDL